MLNFNRRFLPHAATLQAFLYDVLSSPKFKGSHPVSWWDAFVVNFNGCKAYLCRTSVLSHPHPSVPLTWVKVASTTAMGTVLQLRLQGVLQPLAFFTGKLSPAQQMYGALNSELLAIYVAVRYFRHTLEARHFTILTEHKTLTLAMDDPF